MPAEWDADLARQMRDNRMAYKHIAEHFGLSPTTVRARIVPEFAAMRRAKDRDRGRALRAANTDFVEAAKSRKAAGTKPNRSHVRSIEDDAEAMRQLANMPPDRRSLTGRIAGDPPFERSALYAKLKQQETRI